MSKTPDGPFSNYASFVILNKEYNQFLFCCKAIFISIVLCVFV